MSSRRNQLSLLAAAFALTLSGCGGGGGSIGSVVDPGPIALVGVSSNHGLAPLAPEEYPDLPVQQPVHGMQAPIIDLDGILHVGADVAPPAAQLATGGDYNGIAISFGRVQDGVGADRVFEYLEEHINVGEYKNTPGLEGYSTPPVVWIAEGTDEEFTEYVVHAVQLINAALPYEKRIVLNTMPAPPLAASKIFPTDRFLSTSRRGWTGTR